MHPVGGPGLFPLGQALEADDVPQLVAAAADRVQPVPDVGDAVLLEFQFMLAPIRFQGVTGSPVNPLAVF
ncbi:MAG: hypothetical protein WBM50_13895 [Acidimicrobiales bacterium]